MIMIRSGLLLLIICSVVGLAILSLVAGFHKGPKKRKMPPILAILLAVAGAGWYVYVFCQLWPSAAADEERSVALSDVTEQVAKSQVLPEAMDVYQGYHQSRRAGAGTLEMSLLVFEGIDGRRELVQYTKLKSKGWSGASVRWQEPVSYKRFSADLDVRVSEVELLQVKKGDSRWLLRCRRSVGVNYGEGGSRRSSGASSDTFHKFLDSDDLQNNSGEGWRSRQAFGPGPDGVPSSRPFWRADADSGRNVAFYWWLTFIPEDAEVVSLDVGEWASDLIVKSVKNTENIDEDYPLPSDSIVGPIDMMNRGQWGPAVFFSIVAMGLGVCFVFPKKSLAFPILCAVGVLGISFIDFTYTQRNVKIFLSAEASENQRLQALADARCSLFHQGRMQRQVAKIDTTSLPPRLASYHLVLLERWEKIRAEGIAL